MTTNKELAERLRRAICNEFGAAQSYADNVFVRVQDDGEGTPLNEWLNRILPLDAERGQDSTEQVPAQPQSGEAKEPNNLLALVIRWRDFHTKSAGLLPEIAKDKEKFSEFLTSISKQEAQLLVDTADAITTQGGVMEPCIGENCGSTTPKLHSADCFAEHERVVGAAISAEERK